jgi:protoporphyrinogen oxidase/glycosyltransferase involved in cell wall biosynthesis
MGNARPRDAGFSGADAKSNGSEPVLPAAGLDTGATILVFSHLRYDFVFQRPQQVMSRLARRHRILFVEEPVRTDEQTRLLVWQPAANIKVLQPHTPLAAPGFHDDQVPLLRELLQSTFDAVQRPVVWLYTPMALPLVADLDAAAIVYDCMDELSAFRFAPRQLQQRETALLKRADIVFTGGRSLYRSRRSRHGNVLCYPSAVDASHFAPQPGWQDPWPDVAHPRLGYFGVIDERIDLPLLDRLARERPQWQFYMVGPVAKIDTATLPRRSNIEWLGQQSFDSLPRMVSHWDVCLMPFATNEATRFISPTKTLEYMAAGKPIVSTNVRDVADCFGDIVRVARGPAEFVQACDAALAERDDGNAESRRETMQHLAADLSWDATVNSMELAVLGSHRRAVTANYENVIIGAGPAGLAAALGLSRDTLLVEREERVGGQCRSIETNGYTFDHAGHVMASQDAHVLALYERLLGANVHWQNREAWIYSGGAYTRAQDSPNTRFGYPLRGGFQALMDGFLPLLPGELRTGAEVAAIDGPARCLTLSNGATIGYENLVCTAPLPALVRMLGEIAPVGVRQAAEALRFVSARCVNLGVRRTDVTDKHWIYYPDDAIFDRIFVQANASPDCSPPGCFGFTCEIAYSATQPLPCTGQALLDRVVADCRRVGFLRADDVIDVACAVDIPLAHVASDEHSTRNVQRIRHWLATLDIHLAGRYAEWECYDSDHAFMSGRRAAQKLMHRLGGPAPAQALHAS